MFNPTQLVIDAFIDRLRDNYLRTYGILEPHFPNMISFMGRLALENIGNSDAPYHDVNHTVMVTAVGQEILRGKHLREGRVSPRDWLHFTVALLCHDIGFVRGICKGDRDGHYVINEDDQTIFLPPGSTDAAMAPHRVNRAKMFVRQRFEHVDLLEVEVINSYLEHTRFPVPDAEIYRDSKGYAGLLRAADLIGEIADPSFLRKSGVLFAEFQESGRAAEMGYTTAADLRNNYPTSFKESIGPLVEHAVHLLRVTEDGKQWLAHLYAHLYAEEHRLATPGVERGKDWGAPDS